MKNQKIKNKGVVLFDEHCLLCLNSVLFILKRDTYDYFRFASLQSSVAKQILDEFEYTNNSESIIFIKNNSLFKQSDAILEIIKSLKYLSFIYYIVKIIPKSIREWIYKLIAKNRIKWFGKNSECYIPKENEKLKFL